MALRVAAIVVLAALLSQGQPALSPNNAKDRALQLAVLLNFYDKDSKDSSSRTKFGTGIIVGVSPRAVYVATASHLIEPDNRIEVRFGYEGSDGTTVQSPWVPGTLDCDAGETSKKKDPPEPPQDDEDAALLTVDRSLIPKVLPNLAILADVSTLPALAGVYPAGFADGREPLYFDDTGESTLLSASNKFVDIQSAHVVNGMSGGPLFDDGWLLIGMNVSGQLRKRALRIEQIKTLLADRCGGEKWTLASGGEHSAQLEVIKDLAKAIEDADLNTVLTLFPSLPDSQSRQQQWEDRRRLWNTTIDVLCEKMVRAPKQPNRVGVNCSFTWTLTGNRKMYRNGTYVSHERFDLERRGGGWIVQGWQSSER
jgi:hypothetical protein